VSRRRMDDHGGWNLKRSKVPFGIVCLITLLSIYFFTAKSSKKRYFSSILNQLIHAPEA
jgi:hypothetical protein